MTHYIRSYNEDHRLPLLLGAYLLGGGHSSRRRLAYEEGRLWTLCVLLLVAPAMAYPTWTGVPSSTSSKPRWVNPCDLGHVFDPSVDMEGAPPLRLDELYRSVKERARVAKEHAAHVKDSFFKLTFGDPDFVKGTAMHRQSWLPRTPPLDEQHFSSITKEEAFRNSYEFLQYYAVGIEQIRVDQVIHGGQFVSLIQDVENHLTQVLCELQLGLFTLQIEASPDVMRDVMNQDYRDIESRSRRNIRDYLILRDYVRATQFVAELFAFMERTL